MKRYLAPPFLCLSLATFALSEGIPTRAKDATPEYKQAIEQLNLDAKAWNARCTVTKSDAEQKWCEQQRVALEARKVSLKNGVLPASPAANASTYPTVDVTLRYSTHGKILKRVQTDSTGHFTLGTFPASVYIIEFRARKVAGIQDKRFAIQIDGIKARGQQGGIQAQYLIGGFGVDVETAPGMPVTGQVTTGSLAPTKRMVWIRPEMGSNFPGHWAEEGSSQATAGAGTAHMSRQTVEKIQERSNNY